MKTKIELINGNYYDVTYDENKVAILMVLIGNYDDMLYQVNDRLEKNDKETADLKSEINKLTYELKKLKRMHWNKKPIDALKYANKDFSTCFEECESFALEFLKRDFLFIFKD